VVIYVVISIFGTPDNVHNREDSGKEGVRFKGVSLYKPTFILWTLCLWPASFVHDIQNTSLGTRERDNYPVVLSDHWIAWYSQMIEPYHSAREREDQTLSYMYLYSNPFTVNLHTKYFRCFMYGQVFSCSLS